MRAFLDANIVLSASLRADGRAGGLFDERRSGGSRLLSTGYVLNEAERNLTSKAPHALSRFRQLVLLLDLVAEADHELLAWAVAFGLPDKDAPILAAAAMGRSNLLITGDRRHFGHLFGQTLRGVLVLSLKDGLEAILAAAERPTPPPRHG